MPRIRSVKPEFWEDEDLAEVSRDARLLFIGIWNFVDDEGRMKYSDKHMKAKIFPYDQDVSATRVASLVRELANHSKGFVQLYSIDGISYLQVRNFTRHQRIDKPQMSVLPPPPDPTNYPTLRVISPDISPDISGETGASDECSCKDEREMSGDSTNVPRPFSLGEERKGIGEEKNPAPAARSASLKAFERFWETYRQVQHRDKQSALLEWLKLKVDRELFREIMAALDRQIEEQRNPVPGVFVPKLPYACRWLKRRRWEDGEPDSPPLPATTAINDSPEFQQWKAKKNNCST